MMVTALPRAVARYIASFDLAAVCQYRDGRLGVSRDPEGAGAAWWATAKEAGAVLKRARANGGDILAAARALDIALTAHARLVTRANAAAKRLGLAQADGELGFFNRQYRERRVAARAAGRGFMSYRQARGRLHRALADVAASDAATPSLIDAVFGRDGEP